MPMVNLPAAEPEPGTVSPATSNPALDKEALFTAIGLGPILAAKPTLHKHQWRKAAGLSDEIRKRILSFVASDSFQPANDVPDFDYNEALGYASQDALTPEQAQALNAVLDPELALDLGVQAVRILTWADGVIPRDTAPHVLGARAAEPDRSATADFRRNWHVALDPMFALDELDDGSLSDDQVATLALLYPQVYQEMRQAVTDAMATMEARRKGWEPAPQKAALLSMLRQEQQIDPQLAAQVQQVYAVQPDARPAPSAARRRARKTGGGDAGEGLTPGSRAAGGVG
jgi:hypothetical protein